MIFSKSGGIERIRKKEKKRDMQTFASREVNLIEDVVENDELESGKYTHKKNNSEHKN